MRLYKSAGLVLCLLCTLILSAQYHSLCWRISGRGLQQPSYLYGTMHVADSRVFHFSTGVLQAFDGSKAYIMELDPDKAMNMSVLTQLIMTDGSTIQKLIPDSDYRYIDSMLQAATGYGMAIFNVMEPVIVSTLLEQYNMGLSVADSSMSDEMDLYFYKKAKKKKKKLIGLESVEEQITALHALSYAEQATLLSQTVQEMKQPKDSNAVDVLKYYIAQNLDSLLAMSDEHQLPPKFYKALITDRNIRMAERINGYIQKQPTFIAVGALHLPGAEGVIELLRRQGYKVEEWR